MRQDDLTHSGHDGSADTAGDRERDEPREHDVAEYRPVDVLARSKVSDEHDGADLAVRRADRDADVGRDENGQGGADLDAESAVDKQGKD